MAPFENTVVRGDLYPISWKRKPLTTVKDQFIPVFLQVRRACTSIWNAAHALPLS